MNLSRDEMLYMYTSHFCEENIYKLTEQITNSKKGSDNFDINVIFISSKKQITPFWNQKLCKNDKPIFWDYHVILLVIDNDNNEKIVYDYDTTLHFPCNAHEYCIKSFNSLDEKKLILNGMNYNYLIYSNY
jgi:hypothetical protein